MRYVEKRFLLLTEFKFHHTMLVLNAFLAISENLVSDNQSSPNNPPPPSFLKRLAPLASFGPSPRQTTLPSEKTPGYGPDF